MEWLREELKERMVNGDNSGAYCYYIGCLEQCIRSRDLDRADEAMKIGQEVFGWIVKY